MSGKTKFISNNIIKNGAASNPTKQKEMDKMVSMYHDFDPEDITITKNETGLDEVQFF